MSCLNQSWTLLWGPAGSLLSGTAVGGSWLAGSPSISVHTDPPAHAGAGTPCAQAGRQVPVLSLSRAAASLATYGTARQDATCPAPALGLHQLTLPSRCPVLPSAARPVPAHTAGVLHGVPASGAALSAAAWQRHTSRLSLHPFCWPGGSKQPCASPILPTADGCLSQPLAGCVPSPTGQLKGGRRAGRQAESQGVLALV